ncbi:hypothetical protein [Halalkalirubrum salinum]|uniref:hypothetical protein n=1 Tax=Halalkalirubrum salinum TaxID=2563889 RepID=UPI0010FB12E4|nr:hypothetical protein [Halalkalirubrum salinum]
MPAKSSGSHLFGHLVSLIAAGLLVEHINTFLPSFEQVSYLAGSAFTAATDISVSPEVSGMFLISTVLISLWGVGYHFYH